MLKIVSSLSAAALPAFLLVSMPACAKAVIYSFKSSPDGEQPRAGLAKIGQTLYGTTALGGTAANGTVYSITRAGKETVIYSFQGGSDGSQPASGLVDFKGT